MEEPVLHVVVVGFHHKKGCQVEYSYPPLIEGNSVESHEIPEEWKHIPSLALPDGAHNYEKDTVYFVLPGRKDSPQTIYGVSCYRQMNSTDLINRTADVTRSTVQKSVCVLSKLPLFGLIKAKLELITHAYFDERDFSQVTLLEQTYNNLNASLTQSLLQGTQVFLGLSVRDLVVQYKHKILVLFKLLLLERRVLFFGSPVEKLSQTILSVISLFPGMLESGLVQSCNQFHKKLSPTMGVTNLSSDQEEGEDFLEIRYHSTTPETPLSEVMGHLHNSALQLGAGGDNTGHKSIQTFEQEEEHHGLSRQTSAEAPESPSIQRDQDNSNMLVSKLPSSGVVQEKKNCVGIDDRFRHFSRSSSNSSSEGGKLSVHAFSKSSKLEKRHSAELAEETVTYHEDESPLLQISAITQIESIQTETCVGINDFISNFEHSGSNQNRARAASGNLTLSSTALRSDEAEIIEDLDSPESISKIDREDCFSWEQDKLQLAFDHVLPQEEALSVNANPVEVTASKDSVSDSGKESVSSEALSASATSLDAEALSSTANFNNSTYDKITPSPKSKSRAIKDRLTAAFTKSGSNNTTVTNKDVETVAKINEDLEVAIAPTNLKRLSNIILDQDQFGHPLAIFTKGCVCHPYLGLQYHDILTDVNITSFIIGATNILFKQRRQLIDIVIEVGDGKIDIRDKELQRQLSLTTADLRFAEYLVKAVTEESQGSLYGGTEWEGSDEWIRAQFKQYLNSLLATVLTENSKLIDDFGYNFVTAWKTTHNFRHWHLGDHSTLKEVNATHPFHGNINMMDMKMRLNHTFQSSDRGKKINAAVEQTGKYVAQTGKVVGSAISSAKSAFSGWFSGWRSAPDKVITDESSDQTKNGDVKQENDYDAEEVLTGAEESTDGEN